MKIIGVIPARFASTRFPGKPLALIGGETLIERVIRRCQLASSLSEVIVATDDSRIADVARRICRVEFTRDDHPSGTDRIAEVATRVLADAYINIQGDEPLMDPAVIESVADLLKTSPMTTAATPLRELSEYDNPNVVKVVVTVSEPCQALYFSRRTIPFLRVESDQPIAAQLAAFPFLKHLGIYGYQRDTLLQFVKWPVSSLENAEKLEQLRALERGIRMGVARVTHDSIGVDRPEDVARVEALLATGRPLKN